MKNSSQASARRTWWLLAALVLLAGAGCGGPKTYPVKGKVIFKRGGPVTDGRIQFQSTTDPQVKAVGDIDADGSFSLTTYVAAKKAGGAPAGTYNVVVELEKPARVVTPRETYTVEPRDNDITVAIEKPKR